MDMSFVRVTAVVVFSLFWGRMGIFGVEPPLQRPPHTTDMVWLKTNERFRGELVALDPKTGLVWHHPEIQEDLPFPLSETIKVRLGTRPVPPLKLVNPCLVRLANQDELEGDLTGFDGETLLVDTWYAGTLRIPRRRVESVQPIVANPKIVFQGPTSLEGWTLGNAVVPGVQTNAWTYSDGALVSLASGSVARDVKLPDVAAIDFDLAWSTYLYLAIALYADQLQPINLAGKDEAPDFGGFYSLQLNANIADIRTVKKGVPLNSLGLVFVPGMELKTSAHITIRTHKAERAVYLYVDGVLIKQWRDPMETLGPGTCLRFVNQLPNMIKLSNLVVSEWDGRLDVPTNIVNTITNDVVRLLNRDAVAGTVKEIRDGNVSIASNYGPITIPLNRIEQIHFTRAGRDIFSATSYDIQALFAKRGRLALKIEGWDYGQLVANSPIFGRARFSLAAFRMFEWKDQEAAVGPR
jgi:small nuclear ribonucleoprotein (snRNP)-like protein